MYSFSKRSLDNLATAEEKLQLLFNEVIKEIDCTVIYGHRTPEEQFELFKQGREKKDGWWVKVGATVTNLDGNIKKSKHNYLPSKAVDVVPYPLDWKDIESFKNLAIVVKKKAEELGIEVEWGGDWVTPIDMPHYELKDKK